MGIASYRRGSAVISRQIASEARSAEFEVIDRLNATVRKPGAQAPWGDVHIHQGHGGWWASCPVTGYGFHYACLRSLMAAWLIDIVEVRWANGEPAFVAKPWSSVRAEQHRSANPRVVS